MKYLATAMLLLVSLVGLSFTVDRSTDQPKETTRILRDESNQVEVEGFDKANIPALASRNVLYSSGVPHGQFRAIGVDDGCNIDCYLVDLAAQKIRFAFSGPAKGAYYAEISPQENYLASSRVFEKTIALWSIETGEVVMELAGQKAPTSCLAFSPDESKLAALSSDGEINVWDIHQKRKIASERTAQDEIESFEFVSDHQLVVRSQGNADSINISQ